MKISPKLLQALSAVKEKTGVDFSQYQKPELIEPLLEATRLQDPRWLFLSNFFWHTLIVIALVSGFWLKLSLTLQIIWGIGLFIWVFWLSGVRALKLTARRIFNFLDDLLPPFMRVYQKLKIDLQNANSQISQGDVFSGAIMGVFLPFLQAKTEGVLPFLSSILKKPIENICFQIISFTNDFDWFKKPILANDSTLGFSEEEVLTLQNKILEYNGVFKKIGRFTVLLTLNIAYWGVAFLGLAGIGCSYLLF
jgi:hypothetical protein